MKVRLYFNTRYGGYSVTLTNVESVDEIRGAVDNVVKEFCSKFGGKITVKVSEIVQEFPIVPIATTTQTKYSTDEVMNFIIKANSDVLTLGSVAQKEKEVFQKEYNCEEVG